MFKKKRWIAASMVMAVMITGCGDEKKPDPTPIPTTPEPTKAATPVPSTPEPTKADTPEPTNAPVATSAPSFEAGKVADFEDDNMSFVAVKESLVTSAETEISVVDFAGSKMLQVVAPDTAKFPYIAIDISSLAGDAIESVRSIEFDIGLASPSDTFYAASGNVYYYVGADNAEKITPWSVYMAVKNPKRASVTLNEDESFVAGAKNIIIISKETDNAIEPTSATNKVYIDNIVLKDASGNAIALNTAAEFNAPDGFADEDWSNLVPVKNEVSIDGMIEKTSSGWWPTSGISTDPAQTDAKVVDASIFGPGQIMTIYLNTDYDSLEDWQKYVKLTGQYYEVEGSEIGAPNWEAFNEQDVADLTIETDEQGKTVISFNFYKLAMNDSHTTAQISYDTIASYLGEDWFKYVKFLGIADYGYDLEVTRVTVGEEKKVLPATINNTEVSGFAVKGDGWAQAGVDTVAAGGSFDVSLLKPGCVITVDYKSEGSLWLVADSIADMGAPYGWTRIAYDETAEVKGMGAVNDDHNQVQFTYDQIVAALGTEDFSAMSKLQCESDQAWEVFKVTIGEYAPEALKFTDEVMIENSAVKAAGWAQDGVTRVADGGTFDYTLLVPGTVVNVYYKENGANYWLVANPVTGEAPYDWSRIGDGNNGTSRMDPKKCIMQITYDQIVEVLGTEDFSTMAGLQVESSEEWEIYGIGIAKLAE